MQLSEIVKKYIDIRDKKKLVRERHKAELEKYDTALKKIEAVLQDYFNQSGVNSVNTDGGTAYRKLATTARVADRDAWLDWVFANNARAFLEMHVSDKAIKEYLEANDVPPPGIDITNTFLVRVNRP